LLFSLLLPRPPRSTLFPYTTLFRSQCSLRRNPLRSILCYPDINRRRRSCEPRSLCTHYSPRPRGHNSQSDISPPCSRRECRDKPAERGPSISHIFESNPKQSPGRFGRLDEQRYDGRDLQGQKLGVLRNHRRRPRRKKRRRRHRRHPSKHDEHDEHTDRRNRTIMPTSHQTLRAETGQLRTRETPRRHWNYQIVPGSNRQYHRNGSCGQGKKQATRALRRRTWCTDRGQSLQEGERKDSENESASEGYTCSPEGRRDSNQDCRRRRIWEARETERGKNPGGYSTGNHYFSQRETGTLLGYLVSQRE